MFEVKRFTKKEKKKRFRGGFSVLLICSPLVLVLFFLLYYSKRPLYISPVPPSGKGVAVSPALDRTRELFQKLSEAHVQYNSIVPIDGGLMIQTSLDEEIIFSNSKNLDNQISSLQLIKRSLTIEGKQIARLDFRFDNPVIIFK